MKDKPEKITNEEYERAFHELAVFLYDLYKKDKLKRQQDQDDAV